MPGACNVAESEICRPKGRLFSQIREIRSFVCLMSSPTRQHPLRLGMLFWNVLVLCILPVSLRFRSTKQTCRRRTTWQRWQAALQLSTNCSRLGDYFVRLDGRDWWTFHRKLIASGQVEGRATSFMVTVQVILFYCFYVFRWNGEALWEKDQKGEECV